MSNGWRDVCLGGVGGIDLNSLIFDSFCMRSRFAQFTITGWEKGWEDADRKWKTLVNTHDTVHCVQTEIKRIKLGSRPMANNPLFVLKESKLLQIV